VYLNQRQLANGEGETGFAAAQRVLMNPCVDSAVIETGFHAILESGLSYDRCAVGIVTGIDPTETLPEFYIDQEAQLANVARTQVDVVLPDGCAVLNAADPLVASMAKLCDGEVMLFASSANTPGLAEHLANGGRAVFMRAGRMIFATGNAQTPIAIPAGVPVAGSPELTQLLAAAAAAWALDMSPQAIGAELAAFLDELRSAFIRAVPATASASAY
jgi:cyanophycin synthetase